MNDINFIFEVIYRYKDLKITEYCKPGRLLMLLDGVYGLNGVKVLSINTYTAIG